MASTRDDPIIAPDILLAMFLWIFLPSAAFSQEGNIPSLLDICYEPLDRGTPGPEAGVKYYFDKSMAMCFPYRYEGFGGGRNTFPSDEECRAWCLAADQQTCGANKEPTGSCLEWENFNCPQNSICKRGGLGVGICCDKENEMDWEKEYNPSCSPGYSLATKTVWWGEVPVRGRRCAEEFCPDESQCFEGKWLAYCCLAKGSGELPPLLNEDSPYQ